MSPITIRNIEPADDPFIAKIIRDTLKEFGANKPGTVYFDPTTDHLSQLFTQDRSAYFIAEQDGQIVGGGGIYPTEALPEGTCELVKMYLLPPARGKGIGGKIISQCLAHAKDAGYSQVYLESMPELQQALQVYERFGFRYLDAPLGNSGHFGCGLWMLKKV